jgi:putative transport protein
MNISIFLILFVGALASKLRFGSLYLGALGSLLIGIIGGHYGILVPQALIDFGVLTLIFVIGVQAGPKFIRTFRKDGVKILSISCLSVLISTLVGLILREFLPMQTDIFLGAMAGGLSSAAAFAALSDTLSSNDVRGAIIGYSASYPASTILVLLFVPFITFFLKKKFPEDEGFWRKSAPKDLERKGFVLSNSKLFGKKLKDLEIIKSLPVNLSRVIRNGDEISLNSEFIFNENDIVVAVGTSSALDGLTLVFGEEVKELTVSNQSLLTSIVYVTSFEVAGKSIQELNIRNKYGVMITRIRRDGVEFLPRADFILEFGDALTVIGEAVSTSNLEKDFNPDSGRLEQSQLIPLIAGLLGGVFLGSIPVSVYGSTPIKLGSAGGVFLVSMFLGYVRGLGRIRLYLPVPASNILRDLGLLIFIVGTGTLAGKDLDSLLTPEGFNAFILGSIVTLVLLVSTFIIAKIIKLDSFGLIGSICGSLNASSALPQSGSKYLREVSSHFYASIYPVSLVAKIIAVQILLAL